MTETEAEKLAELERDLVALKISNATLVTTLNHLSSQVTALNATVQTLNNLMNTGRGALLGVMLLAGAVGAVVTTFVKKALGVV